MEKVHSRIGPCHPQCSRVACAQRRPVVLGSRNRQRFIILKQISRVDAGGGYKTGSLGWQSHRWAWTTHIFQVRFWTVLISQQCTVVSPKFPSHHTGYQLVLESSNCMHALFAQLNPGGRWCICYSRLAHGGHGDGLLAALRSPCRPPKWSNPVHVHHRKDSSGVDLADFQMTRA